MFTGSRRERSQLRREQHNRFGSEIAGAQLATTPLKFVGLSRGETVALAYVNQTPISIVIHVIGASREIIPPSLLRREAELAHGIYGSDFQTSNSMKLEFRFLNSLAWSQQSGRQRLDVTARSRTVRSSAATRRTCGPAACCTGRHGWPSTFWISIKASAVHCRKTA